MNLETNTPRSTAKLLRLPKTHLVPHRAYDLPLARNAYHAGRTAPARSVMQQGRAASRTWIREPDLRVACRGASRFLTPRVGRVFFFHFTFFFPPRSSTRPHWSRLHTVSRVGGWGRRVLIPSHMTALNLRLNRNAPVQFREYLQQTSNFHFHYPARSTCTSRQLLQAQKSKQPRGN